MMKKLYLTLLLLFAFMLPVAAVGANVKITVETPGPGNKVGFGETFYIVITATNCPGQLDVPGKPPGTVLLYNSSSQSMSTVQEGGKVTRNVQTVLTLTCKGASEGKYTFGPVKVGDVTSNKVTYEVTKAPQGRQAAPSASSSASGAAAAADDYDENGGPKFIGKGNDEIFLKASVSKTSAYEQEALVYTVKLYTTYEPIKFLGATAAPKFEGFVVEESKDISSSLSFEQYNGKNYATAIIARYIIFPQKAGKLKIQGNTYTVSTDARQYYHDPFFQTLTVKRPIQLNVTPNDLVIDVRELPSPAPAGFSGAVGQFRITSTLPTQKYLTNTAASIVYEVEGTGNIKYVKLPELSALYPEALEVYSPTSTVEDKVGATNVTGKVKFDYTFVPMETGSFNIPEVRFVYFNPSSGKYETSVAKGYRIEVGRGTASDRSQKALRFDRALMSLDKGSVRSGRPYVYSWIYWLFYILPAVGFMASLFMYRNYQRQHADEARLKSRRAGKMARRRLRKAGACLHAGKRDEFYDEMLSAIWGYLGDKLRMPTSELTRQNVTQVLEEHGLSAEEISPALSLLDDCEFAKYATGIAAVPMDTVYSRGVDVIEKMEKDFQRAENAKTVKENEDEEI